MADINGALAQSREAVDALVAAGERTGPAWTAPRAPGKWSPSQIVEHVARSLEESANVVAGRPSKFPKLPALLHPILRGVVFNRVIRKGTFPTGGRTAKAMNPASGPETPADGRARLEAAHRSFDEACRQLATGERLQSPTFGVVRVEDYVRFMELHTRHHRKQIGVET